MRFALVLLAGGMLTTGVAQAAASDAVYALPHNERAIVSTVRPPHGGEHLHFVRTDTGAVRFMKPSGNDRWTIGNALIPNGSVVATLTKTKRALRIDSGSTSITATEIMLERTPVSFQNAGLTLHGTILRPVSKRALPGIVLMHGSDEGLRDDNGFIPYLLASHGVAVLTYDKRGSGESVPATGYFGAELLSDDGIAAAHALAHAAGVDPKRTGVWGPSQGGMLALVMAGKDPSIAFVIDQSGYFTPTWQADTFEIQSALHDAHVSDADIAAATAFENQKYEAARTATGWEALAAAAAAAKASPWIGNVFVPASEASLQRYWKRHASFDPTAGLPVHARVLAMYGSLDKSSPMPESADNVLAFLARSGNTTSTVVTFPNANHLMLDATNGYMSEIGSLASYNVPYLRTLTAFIDSL